MKNQVDFFEKVVKVLRELKTDYPHIEISKHYILATDSANFSLSDKELYQALIKHKSELDMNTVSDREMEKVINDTGDLFSDVEEDGWDDPDY